MAVMPADQTANEALRDALLRHQTYLLRYSGQLRNDLYKILDATEQDIAEKIRGILGGGTGLTTPVEARRLQRLLAAIEAIRMPAWDEASKHLDDQLTQLSYQEPSFTQGIFDSVSPVVLETTLPPPNLLRAIVQNTPFEGQVLKDWAAQMASEDLRRMTSMINMGMIAGEPSNTIAQRVLGTTSLLGNDGVTALTRRQVETVTRTAVQSVANTARNYFVQDNADIILKEVFVATLDSRTTPICRSYDGDTFPVGEGPVPPLHFNCRSLRAPVMDPALAGTRPFVTAVQDRLASNFAKLFGLKGVGAREDLPRGFKGKFDEWAYEQTRSMIGQVPAATSYGEWLAAQSVQFQEDTLGVAKAALFRDGGLTLDKFVAQNGTELNLSQLASRHRSAFKAAGLDPADYLN
jgi:SPP1 gp7 family putative phage head morphogenesis protein